MAFLRDPGPLAQYNSLADEHLAHYFANPRIRNHLLHAGLITKDGYVVDEVTWREKVARTEHREHVKNLLAQTIVEKAIDIERRRMTTLKRDFEDLVKLASVQRLKDSKSRGRSHEPDDDFVALLRPRLASTEASRSHRQKRSAESLRSPPSTPDSTMTSLSSRGGPFVASPYAMVPSTARTRARRNQSTPPREKLRPKTAPPALSKSEPLLYKRSQTQSLAKVTLRYLGDSLQLDRYRESNSDEVTIIQQHGGGSSLCVFRGSVKPKECFHFVSKRSRGSPYGITIYVNSLLDSRFGTCCEYKHKPGSRLGGKTARFRLVRVEGAAPCYRCQVDAELGSKQQPVRIRERKISRTFVIKESSPTVVVTTSGDDKKAEKHESDGDSDDIDVDAVLRRYRETSKDDSSSEDEKKSDVRPGTSLSLNIPPIPVINVENATPLPSDAGTSSSSSESESEKRDDFAEASGYSSDEEEEEEEKEEAVPEQEPPKLSSNSDDNDETKKKSEVEEVKYSEEEFEEEADSRKESDHDDDRTNRDSEDAKASQDVLNEKDDEIVESESRDDDDDTKAEERLDVDKEEANVKKESDGVAKDESEPEVEPDVTTAGENEEKKESDGVEDVATGKESESEESDDASRPAVEADVTTTGENEETKMSDAKKDEEKDEDEVRPAIEAVEHEEKKMSDAKKDEEKDEDESRPAIEPDVATAVEHEEKSEDAESRSVKKDSDKETIEKESDGDEDEKESDEIESRSATATIDSREEKRTKVIIDSNEEENIQEKSPEDRPVPEIQIRRTQSQDLLDEIGSENDDETRDEFAPTKPPFETMASAKNLLRQTTSGLSIRLSDDDEGKINDDDILSSVTSSSVSLLDSSKIPSLTNSLSDVAAMKSRNSRSSLKEMHRVGRTPQTSSGELSEPVAPLVKGKEDVELANVALTEKQVKEVAAVLEEEEVVNTVSFRNASVTDKGAAAVAEAIMTNETSVKMLNFNLNNLGAKGAKHVAKTLRRKSLEFLLLHGNKIGDEGLRHIVDSLVGETTTTSTMIPRPPPGNPPENRRRLRRRQRRRSSSSSSTSSTSSLSSIASTVLAPNSSLTCLDVGDCGLTASAASHVTRLLAGNSSLKELNLSANRLGVDAWRQIGDGLGKNSSLTSLCLDYCDLGDDGLVALCDAFAHTTSLKSVDLEGNGITDRGARVLLEALKLNSTLVELTLAPGNSISSELMSELAVALKSRQE